MFPMISAAILAIASICTLGMDPGDHAEPVADEVILSDGSPLLGEVQTPSERGVTLVVVRRAWAKAHLPKQLARWESLERPGIKRAIQQRRNRLQVWRALRGEVAEGKSNAIDAWLEREIERLKHAKDDAESRLMIVRLRPGDFKSVKKSSVAGKGWLRLGWTADFANPESMAPDDLKLALEGRGYDLTSPGPVRIDDLLPPREETDAAWLSRRAATEILNDEGLRFNLFQEMVIPEPTGGGEGALSAIGPDLLSSALKNLLDERKTDPLLAVFRKLETRGRSSALVTRLDIAPSLESVRVEIMLWVRPVPGSERWVMLGTHAGTSRTEEADPASRKAIEEDPQVKMVFQLVESLGLGDASPGLKARSSNVGAATSRALGIARKASEASLGALALPLAATRAGEKEKAAAPR
jgi:hypothetical protein